MPYHLVNRRLLWCNLDRVPYVCAQYKLFLVFGFRLNDIKYICPDLTMSPKWWTRFCVTVWIGKCYYTRRVSYLLQWLLRAHKRNPPCLTVLKGKQTFKLFYMRYKGSWIRYMSLISMMLWHVYIYIYIYKYIDWYIWEFMLRQISKTFVHNFFMKIKSRSLLEIVRNYVTVFRTKTQRTTLNILITLNIYIYIICKTDLMYQAHPW